MSQDKEQGDQPDRWSKLQAENERLKRAEIAWHLAEADNTRLRAAAQEACDLLAERVQGSPARSPGHNARLILEGALHASIVSQQKGESEDQNGLCSVVLNKNGA